MADTLLLCIDYQNDFVAEDGALSAGAPARRIEPYLSTRIQAALAAGQDVAFTLDTHHPNTWANHPESKAFPPHCQKGTAGWQLFGSLAALAKQPGALLVEKAAYCPDFSLLERWTRQYKAIQLCGVATHICVLHTAIGLYTAKVNLGLPVRLVLLEKGCASFDAQAEQFALAHMKGVLGLESGEG